MKVSNNKFKYGNTRVCYACVPTELKFNVPNERVAIIRNLIRS